MTLDDATPLAMMAETSVSRKLVAEFTGTCLLLATVVGSGIMAESLSGGNTALALLGNTLATALILVVIIWMFAPISGAHFNPAVSAAFLLRGDIAVGHFVAYLAAQCAGATVGVLLAHAMFDLNVLQVSSSIRTGGAQWLSECVATFGLVLTILGCLKWREKIVGLAVGMYIGAAYWFTASTSFANPAVTLGRTMTDTFSGIRPADAPAFVGAQFAGAVLALLLAGWLFAEEA